MTRIPLYRKTNRTIQIAVRGTETTKNRLQEIKEMSGLTAADILERIAIIYYELPTFKELGKRIEDYKIEAEMMETTLEIIGIKTK